MNKQYCDKELHKFTVNVTIIQHCAMLQVPLTHITLTAKMELDVKNKKGKMETSALIDMGRRLANKALCFLLVALFIKIILDLCHSEK